MARSVSHEIPSHTGTSLGEVILCDKGDVNKSHLLINSAYNQSGRT